MKKMDENMTGKKLDLEAFRAKSDKFGAEATAKVLAMAKQLEDVIKAAYPHKLRMNSSTQDAIRTEDSFNDTVEYLNAVAEYHKAHGEAISQYAKLITAERKMDELYDKLDGEVPYTVCLDVTDWDDDDDDDWDEDDEEDCEDGEDCDGDCKNCEFAVHIVHGPVDDKA